jgi:mono/diheme cytochrome c family protein
MRTQLLVPCVLALLASAACSKSEARQLNMASIPQESRDIFAQRCSTCHGTDGKGTGAAAAALQTKPRNYTDKAWQASVTDAQLEKTIVEGGAAVGKSPLMPPNPDLKTKPDVVRGLVTLVRSFGQ